MNDWSIWSNSFLLNWTSYWTYNKYQLTIHTVCSIKSVDAMTLVIIDQICTSSVVLTRMGCTLIDIWRVKQNIKGFLRIKSNKKDLKTLSLTFYVLRDEYRMQKVLTVFTSWSIESCHTITIVVIYKVCTRSVVLTRTW